MKLDELKEGLNSAWNTLTDGVTEGWQRLRKSVGAITHFKSGEDSNLPASKDVDDEAYWPRTTWAMLAGNVFEDDTKVVVRLEIPGMQKDNFTVEVQNGALIVSGEKRFESEKTEGRYRTFQCAYGAFRRSVQLPAAVIADQAQASYKDGILRIELPKETPAKPRVIEVKID